MRRFLRRAQGLFGLEGGTAGMAIFVKTSPSASTDNVIQPTGPLIIPLIIRGAVGQSAHLTEWQDSASAVMTAVNPDGSVDLSGAATGVGVNSLMKYSGKLVEGFPSGVNKSGGNEFVNMAGLGAGSTIFGGGVDGDTVRRIRFTAGLGILFGSGAAPVDTTIYRGGADQLNTDDLFFVNISNTARVGIVIQPSVAGLTASFLEVKDVNARRLLAVAATGDLVAYRTTTTSERQASDQTVTWATATDATRKARAVFNIWDTAAREAFRIEASGTAPMIGFLGAAAVVRQVGASAAGIAAILDPNAAAAVGALQTALANLGFITSPA